MFYCIYTSDGMKGNPRRRAVVLWPDLKPDTDVVAGSDATSETGQTVPRNRTRPSRLRSGLQTHFQGSS